MKLKSSPLHIGGNEPTGPPDEKKVADLSTLRRRARWKKCATGRLKNHCPRLITAFRSAGFCGLSLTLHGLQGIDVPLLRRGFTLELTAIGAGVSASVARRSSGPQGQPAFAAILAIYVERLIVLRAVSGSAVAGATDSAMSAGRGSLGRRTPC